MATCVVLEMQCTLSFAAMVVSACLSRYRKFKVSADTELVVRCEIDGVLKHKGQDELLSVKALNEFDPKLTGQRLCLACCPAFLSEPVLLLLHHLGSRPAV